MSMKTISDSFAVSPQIAPEDVAALKDKGFTTIICARPDNEEPGQPSFDEIKAAATSAGMTAVYIPIVPGQATNDDVRKMDEALSAADGPVYGYCKGGARAEALYKATGRS